MRRCITSIGNVGYERDDVALLNNPNTAIIGCYVVDD